MTVKGITLERKLLCNDDQFEKAKNRNENRAEQYHKIKIYSLLLKPNLFVNVLNSKIGSQFIFTLKYYHNDTNMGQFFKI
jgi:hypothetical protein